MNDEFIRRYLTRVYVLLGIHHLSFLISHSSLSTYQQFPI